MSDTFTPYENGLDELIKRLGKAHPRYVEAQTLRSQLLENINKARLYGSLEGADPNRSRIINVMNVLSLDACGVSFTELCFPPAPTPPPPEINLAPVATTIDLPTCPFVAGPRIEDPRIFIGRKRELDEIVSSMSGAQPVSLGLVGDRRIGKSSLLYHFYSTFEQRVANPLRYAVVFLSIQEARCITRLGLYQAIANELQGQVSNPSVRNLLTKPNLNEKDFTDALKSLKQNGITAIICLDEFETLLEYPSEFPDDFFDSLRSLMDANLVMFVFASHQPLDAYAKKHKLTSRFFNLGQYVGVNGRLEEFSEEEAQALVQLPASTIVGKLSALTTNEQKLARQWGGRHPYCLQLAGKILYNARPDYHRARKRFERESKRNLQNNKKRWAIWRIVLMVLWGFPNFVGRLGKRTGEVFDKFSTWLMGMVIIIVVLLAVLGIFNAAQVFEMLKKAVGIGG